MSDSIWWDIFKVVKAVVAWSTVIVILEWILLK